MAGIATESRASYHCVIKWGGRSTTAELALSGPAVQAADSVLTASPTSQTFYVNDQRVQFEAYEIHGNNFVKLRDLGRAVNFGVTYDAATNTVHIDSAQPYQEEITPATSSSVTEESVQAALAQLKERYSTGTVYPTPYRSVSSGPYTRGTHCSGWAALCSDTAFGNLPWRRIDRSSWSQLRSGDIVEYRNPDSYHAIVILEKTNEYIYVTESGTHNRPSGPGSTSAGGWRNSPITSATHDTHNKFDAQRARGPVPLGCRCP